MSNPWHIGRKEIIAYLRPYLGLSDDQETAWNMIRRWRINYGLPVKKQPNGKPSICESVFISWMNKESKPNTLTYSPSPRYKLNTTIKTGIWKALNGERSGDWPKLVGYTVDDLIKHLEKQFQPGMTWENYGRAWHIDHIIPQSVFNYENSNDIDFRRCWALENLQPLWAMENMKKNAKISKPFQPALRLRLHSHV